MRAEQPWRGKRWRVRVWRVSAVAAFSTEGSLRCAWGSPGVESGDAETVDS